ncbi:MAG: hypothetical protein SFW07_07625 [Gammaproteobacteria bacterium]|nr:hypothetical protein [Gammaproteobacteria bacterium]
MKESTLKALQPFEITGAIIDNATQLHLMFNNTKDAEEFTKILSGTKRVADIDLGKRHFTIGFTANKSKVAISGNLYNAVDLIEECNLISESSLKNHIRETDLNIAVENSKEVVLQQKKVERAKSQEKTPEQLLPRFSIAVSPPTAKKGVSCFCVRKNKK